MYNTYRYTEGVFWWKDIVLGALRDVPTQMASAGSFWKVRPHDHSERRSGRSTSKSVEVSQWDGETGARCSDLQVRPNFYSMSKKGAG
jgi:hypothetical protein